MPFFTIPLSSLLSLFFLLSPTIRADDSVGLDASVYFDPDDGHLIFTINVVMGLLNIFGITYVLLRTCCQWRRRETLSMGLRLPFYIALTDLTLFLSVNTNHAYSMIHGRPWPGLPCKIIAGTVFFFMSINMTLVGTIAVITYLRVCRKVVFRLGAYDYKLFAIMGAVSLALTLAFMQTLGPLKFWCFTTSTNFAMALALCTFDFGILLTCLFCYISTMREMNSINWDELGGGIAKRDAKVDERVTRKIVAYVLIFVVQWLPASLQSVGRGATWTYIVVIVCINFGGIGNAIQYVINEGWKDRDDDFDADAGQENAFIVPIAGHEHDETKIA